MTRPPPAAAGEAEAAEPVEIADGVLQLRLPLRAQPRHVNVWLLRDGEGWVIVDTGVDTPEIRAIWQRLLDGRLRDGVPLRVLATHFHGDHVGLAGWLCGARGATLLMFRAELAEFHRELGGLDENLEFLRQGRRPYREQVAPLPTAFEAIGGGTRLHIGGRGWDVLTGAGHTPDMACLWSPGLRLLISADHILPRITPHIAITHVEPKADPLSAYLDALGRFRGLPTDTLVLPSHGEPFRGLHQRLDALVSHHEERLARLRSALRQAGSPGLHAYDAVPHLFGKAFEHSRLHMAAAEALAHLACLRSRGELAEYRGTDGIRRFTVIAGPQAAAARNAAARNTEEMV
jgi:glyoxylase-like metal-dependent hydrolase (beta-lactamase superfamily II)